VSTDRLPPHLDIDPLLIENEVAAWLRMSLRTLTRKRKAGLIQGIPWNARRYRYRKSEIERFIRAAEQGAVVYFGAGEEAGRAKANAALLNPSKSRGKPARSPIKKKEHADERKLGSE
jgi:hypothetical protein